MAQSLRYATALVLTFAIAVQCSECRLLQQSTGGSVSRYTETPAAGRSCSTVCQNPLLLANVFKIQPTSYACVAKNGVSGYQAGAGSTTCTVISEGQIIQSQDYSCLCLATNQVPGLSLPDTSGSCIGSCQPFGGQYGASVVVGGNSICMATQETGSTNHFGTLSAGSCTYASGSAATQTSTFSCVCAYGGAGTALGSSTPPPVQQPQPQIATAG